MWETNPHEMAGYLDTAADSLARKGNYGDATAVHNAAQMLRDLWESDNELRTVLTDLVFQCEQYPHIQTDRAKAVLYPSET